MWRGSFQRNHGNRGTGLAVRVQIKGSKRIAQGNKENPTHIFHWAKLGLRCLNTRAVSDSQAESGGGGGVVACTETPVVLGWWWGSHPDRWLQRLLWAASGHLFQEGLTRHGVFLAPRELCSVMSGSPLCPSIHIWTVVICPEQDKSGPRKKCQHDRVRHHI